MDDILAVVTDLFFQSRISAAARAAGRSVRYITSSDALESPGNHTLALVDLDASVDPIEAIRRLSGSTGKIVAFGPHVDTELRKTARSAGAHRVLAKSKFVTDLPRLMAERR